MICSPDDIVVGAGLQPLLQILCPLIQETEKPFHSLHRPLSQGSTIFEDYGFDVHYRDKNCDVIYVSPAHMTKWGEIMPVKRRLELIHHAEANNHLIIEDDFENEFVYLQKPTPSLFGLAGGENVVYIGSFSRLLLPSIRCKLYGTAFIPPDCSQKLPFIIKPLPRQNRLLCVSLSVTDIWFPRQESLGRLYAQKLKSLSCAVREVLRNRLPDQNRGRRNQSGSYNSLHCQR